ncbi:MAG TPA: sigma-70 family RNA polymerase sigma factor [Planctomycetota bacterium]|nr:sigma-70 family RNA polymerase sigma factor [Planctomycetota bacterium]
MGFGDTTLGGADRAFPTTQWSQVLGAQDPNQPGYRDRLDALLRSYWKPAYAYIRVGWKKSNEDAKDLTQAFFARLLQNGRIAAVRTEGGRFRSYLRQALRNFLIDAERAAEVRRPVEPIVAVEDVEVPSGGSPDLAFDRQWLSCLLDVSLARLEAELKKDGKDAYYNVFRTYLLDPSAGREVTVATQSGEIALPTYGSVAKRLGLSESDVRNYLTFCRARLREILKDGIRETVEDARDVEDELRSLLNE